MKLRILKYRWQMFFVQRNSYKCRGKKTDRIYTEINSVSLGVRLCMDFNFFCIFYVSKIIYIIAYYFCNGKKINF